MGMRQVKLRLQGRYGPAAFFEAALRDGHYKVAMTFPIELEEAVHE